MIDRGRRKIREGRVWDKFIETKETKGSESLEDTKFHSIYTLITL